MKFKNLVEKFNQYQHAIYFASADKSQRFVGVGKASELIPRSIEELQQWQSHQAVPVFGGLPFDKQKLASHLMNGYFLAPQYVIEEKANQVWGTLPPIDNMTFKDNSNQIITTINEPNWIKRATLPLQEMLDDPHKQKVVLGMQQTLHLQNALNLSEIIDALNQSQPHAYHIVIKNVDEVFISATPERLVQLNQNTFATAAVAGTTNRNDNPQIDQHLASQLQQDHKNLHEHELVVNEITSKLNSLANLTYPSHPQILKTPQVQHLYTPITGTLKKKSSIFHLVEALHPTPALGGIPLTWALQQIKTTEIHPRGLFAAPLGYVLPNGDGEFVIGIRSLWQQQQTVHLFAGAGILAQSDLNQEQAEIKLKMSVMKTLIKEQFHE